MSTQETKEHGGGNTEEQKQEFREVREKLKKADSIVS